jgi:hypothetical protein
MIKRLFLAVALLCVPGMAQVAVAPLLQPHQHFVDASGAPCSGCLLYSYVAGTTTPTPTYTDAGGVSQNTNPIVLDVSGAANIWPNTGVSYKYVLKTALGATLWTVDMVGSASLPIVSDPAGTQTITQPAGTDFDVNTSVGGKMKYNGSEVATVDNTVLKAPAGDQTVTQPLVGGVQSSLNVNSLNGVLEATLFTGTDIGAKINAAYAALPSTGGKITVNVPVAGFTFTTPIVFATLGKPVQLECISPRAFTAGGLTYTPTTGTAITLDYGQPTQTGYGSGIKNCDIYGPDAAGSTGVLVGGSSKGAVGVVIENGTIARFGTDLIYSDNSWQELVKNVHFAALSTGLGTCLNVTSSVNSGEQMTFENVAFDGCGGSALVGGDGGIKLGGSGMHANFIGAAFDDSTIVDSSSGTYFLDPHFENPAGDFYVFYTHSSGAAVMVNPFFVIDGTCTGTCPDALMDLNGGQLSITGFTNYNSLTYVHLANDASVSSLSPVGIFSSSPVATAPITGSTTGHYFWDLGPQVGTPQFLSNYAMTVNAAGGSGTTNDQFARWGVWLQPEVSAVHPPRLFATQTSNLVDSLTGKMQLENETAYCGANATGWSFWTQSSGTGSADNSARAATLDCHGNLHVATGFFVNDPGTGGDGGQTFSIVISGCTIVVKGGIVTGKSGTC